MNLRGKDKKSSFFYAGLGASIAISACSFGLGTLTNPGPGFLPFTGGLLMILLSGIIYLQARSPAAEGEKELLQIGNRKIFLITAYLILYAVFFRKVGFLLGSFILMTLLFQLLERRSWFGSLLVSATTIFVSYMVFVVWLKVQFPKGFFGF